MNPLSALQIIDGQQARAIMPMPLAIDTLRDAFAERSRCPDGVFPPRMIVPLSGQPESVGVVMPASSHVHGYGVKLSTVVPDNPVRRGLPLVSSLYVLFDAHTGQPRYVFDGAEITAIRTAATSALSVDLLATSDSRRLALIGAGVQARAHAAAICHVRPVSDISIYSRTRSTAELLRIALLEGGFKGEVVVNDTLQQATCGADIVCATTSTTDPNGFIEARDLAPHVHICSIGGRTLDACELKPSALMDAVPFVDDLDSVLTESAEFRRALEAGIVTIDAIGQLGKLIGVETAVLDRLRSERTYFRSVGIAISDLAIACCIAATHDRVATNPVSRGAPRTSPRCQKRRSASHKESGI
ncbi:hypothetical protein WM28_25040 [Burkholderia ubonensis]|uniref:ornithine cyclodeaminase family protein n=1 Tax=Burkholderia ubonensis TaxID=101571 RepID=UPI00075F71BE|nr:ornithine cyclodeaminase family protein [Burkholderia ubonensis]KWO61997.1 hypothetical protein WM28_25040 [Burkholderia ubonensis]